MAGYTDNYGFTWLDGDDDPSTDDYAFFDGNIKSFDALLAASFGHEHTGSASDITNPTLAPNLAIDNTSGALPPGTSVRYKYSYIDSYGNETAASPEAVYNIPAAVSPPGGPSLEYAASGGTLLGGTYFYLLTAYVTDNTAETSKGAISTIALSWVSGVNSITLTLPSVPSGATGFNVYRKKPQETGYTYVTSIDMSVAPPTTWTDAGFASSARTPPAANKTNAVNNITVTLPESLPTGATWKLYRTFVSSNWSGSLLKHVVEETSPGSGTIVTEFNDVGDGASSGTPPTSSSIAISPQKIDMTDMNNVSGVLPPGANVVPYEFSFFFSGQVTTGTKNRSWRCPFDKARIKSITATLGKSYTPASVPVVVDVNMYNGTSWASVYTSGSKPSIPVGSQTSNLSVPNTVDIVEGNLLQVDVDQAGGGTGTDRDLTVTIYMYVQSGSGTVTTLI